MMDRFAGLAIDEIERLEGEVQTQRSVIAALTAALKANMEVIGPPPVGSMYFDSAREDAWELARAALARVTEPA